MTGERTASRVARAVEEHRVISVLRGSDSGRMLEVAKAVLEGGLQIIKVAMTVPDAPSLLEKLAAEGDKAIIGAGSVTTMAEAVEMIERGASFVVCPHTDRRIIDYCRDNGIFVAAGGLTPTECMEADLAGADLVKVYPVTAAGGPTYIRFLLRPMPFLRLMPVGGLEPDTLEDYISAGAVAVGVSALPLDCEEEAINLDTVCDRARAFSEAAGGTTD